MVQLDVVEPEDVDANVRRDRELARSAHALYSRRPHDPADAGAGLAHHLILAGSAV